MSRTKVYVHVYLISDFPITYRNASVLCQSECACRHKTVNMIVFFLKMMEKTFTKGEQSYTCRKLSLERKEGIILSVESTFHKTQRISNKADPNNTKVMSH